MTKKAQEHKNAPSHRRRSRIERRIARVGSLAFMCGACTYLLTWALDYESNILIFLANVFAPALLVLLIGVSVVAELYALISVINVHTIPPHTLIKNTEHDNEIQQLSNAVVERERFIRELVEIAKEIPTNTIILAGDMNSTSRNRVYKIIRNLGFSDAWTAGSRLRGGTWPGPDFPLPSWLVRIDFIFHTKGLVATHAETLPEGYGSDHRGVFATFALGAN